MTRSEQSLETQSDGPFHTYTSVPGLRPGVLGITLRPQRQKIPLGQGHVAKIRMERCPPPCGCSSGRGPSAHGVRQAIYELWQNSGRAEGEDEEAVGRRKESLTRVASMAPLDARFSVDCGVIWEAGEKDKCVLLGIVIGSPCKAMHPSSFIGLNKELSRNLSFLVFLRIMWKFFHLCGDGIQATDTVSTLQSSVGQGDALMC